MFWRSMLRVLEDRQEIERAEITFQSLMKRRANQVSRQNVGWPGGSREEEVSFSSELGIWWVMRQHEEGRYWNVFGELPKGQTQVGNIDVEINFPLTGIRRSIGAVLAKDDAGRISVFHRGKIGGGKKGVSKMLFEGRWKGSWELVQDGDRSTRMVLVGRLDDQGFPKNVADFVREVVQIRDV
jgi:5-methylcytosine-specific restriction protein A